MVELAATEKPNAKHAATVANKLPIKLFEIQEYPALQTVFPPISWSQSKIQAAARQIKHQRPLFERMDRLRTPLFLASFRPPLN